MQGFLLSHNYHSRVIKFQLLGVYPLKFQPTRGSFTFTFTVLLGKTTPVLDKEQPPFLCPGAAGLFGGPEQHSKPMPGWAHGRVNCRQVELPMRGSGTLGGPHNWAWEGHRLEEGGTEQELYPLYVGPGEAGPWAQQHLVLYI